MADGRLPFLIGILLFCSIQIIIAETGDGKPDTDNGRITDSQIVRLILKALRDADKLHNKLKSSVADEKNKDEKKASVTETGNYEEDLRNYMQPKSDENKNGGSLDGIGEKDVLPDKEDIVHNQAQEEHESRRGNKEGVGKEAVLPDQQVVLNDDDSKQEQEKHDSKRVQNEVVGKEDVLPDQQVVLNDVSKQVNEKDEPKRSQNEEDGGNTLRQKLVKPNNAPHINSPKETAQNEDFVPTNNGGRTLRRASSNIGSHLENYKEVAENEEFYPTPLPGQDKRNFYEYIKMWKDGKVPFCIKPNSFGLEFEKTIRNVIDDFNSQTCVQWTEVPCDSDTHHVIIENHPQGCGSYAGYQEGMKNQILALKQPYCVQINTASIQRSVDKDSDKKKLLKMNAIEHEMLHTLGMGHEQSRNDRDKHVTIVWSNVVGGKSNHNYKKTRTRNFGVPYDYGSVMQYSVYAQVLNVNNKAMKLTSGRKYEFLTEADEGVSFYDVMLISRAYKCTETCVGKENIPWCENGGFLTNKCTCRCPRGLEGDRCEKVKDPFDCSKLIELKDGTPHFLQSPAGNDGRYMTGKICHYLIKAPPGYFVKATLNKLDIPTYSRTSCRNWLEIMDGLIGQKGQVYCGESDEAKIFTTSTKDQYYLHENLMMLKFDSIVEGTTGTGFKIMFEIEKSTALRAETRRPCFVNPCKNGGTCSDFGHWITEYTCHCKEGFTGRNCSTVDKKDNLDIVFACGSDNPRNCRDIADQQDGTIWSLSAQNQVIAVFDKSRSNSLRLGNVINTRSCLTFSYIMQSLSAQGVCGELTTELLTTMIMTEGNPIGPFPVVEGHITGCNDKMQTQTLDIQIYDSEYFREERQVFIHVKDVDMVTLDHIKIVKGPCP